MVLIDSNLRPGGYYLNSSWDMFENAAETYSAILGKEGKVHYRELVEKGELENHMVEPMNPTMIRAFKIFGFTALTIGLSLILLIIWAELFGYH